MTARSGYMHLCVLGRVSLYASIYIYALCICVQELPREALMDAYDRQDKRPAPG